jgi:membrane-bound serine protease (ClpP class)
MRRIFLSPILSLFLIVASANAQSTTQATAVSTQPVDTKTAIIQLQGEINDYNRDQLFDHFKEARDLGAKTVILDLDTYGGLVTSGLEISRFLKRQDDMHVIAFVQDKAISAGAMVAMACNEIVMSHSATLGDCAPIVFQFDGTLENLPAAERAKQESPILADFLESARRNHHDPLLASAMVAVEISVYWVQGPDGQKKFVDKDEYTTLTSSGWTDVPGVPVPIDSDKTLLTVDSDQAVQYGLASGEATSADDLASERGLNVLATYETSAGDEIVDWLGGAVVRGILLIIFLSALNVVVHAPGHGVAEVIGLVALLLMLGVPLLTGYAQWWEILVIFIGLGLIAVEILLPGHLFPGITGGILVVIGLVMTFVPKEPGGPGYLPNMNETWIALERGLGVVALGLVCTTALWAWLNRYLPQIPYFKRLILTSVSGGHAHEPAPAVPTWPAVGSTGLAVTELKPGGTVEFYDQSIADRRVASVVSESGFVPPGSKVIVREVAGNHIVVRLAQG